MLVSNIPPYRFSIRAFKEQVVVIFIVAETRHTHTHTHTHTKCGKQEVLLILIV
jgi:hypothetical protein